MITQLLLEALLAIARFILGVLPSWSLPTTTGWANSISDTRIWQWAAWANYWVPLDLAVAFLGVRLAVWAGMYIFDFINWLATKAHIVGGQP